VVAAAAAGDRQGAKALLGADGVFDHASNATVLALLKLLRDLEPE
jgi:hypothetical protein